MGTGFSESGTLFFKWGYPVSQKGATYFYCDLKFSGKATFLAAWISAHFQVEIQHSEDMVSF